MSRERQYGITHQGSREGNDGQSGGCRGHGSPHSQSHSLESMCSRGRWPHILRPGTEQTGELAQATSLGLHQMATVCPSVVHSSLTTCIASSQSSGMVCKVLRWHQARWISTQRYVNANPSNTDVHRCGMTVRAPSKKVGMSVWAKVGALKWKHQKQFQQK